jgi:lipopolysaccharide export system protein LptC
VSPAQEPSAHSPPIGALRESAVILRVLMGAVVVGVLLAGWLLLNSEQNGPAVPASGAGSENPGYSAQDAVLIETASDGHPMYTLRAARIHQEPASEITTLDRVQMQFRDQAGNIWNGRADHGRVVEQASQVELTGNVLISGLAPGTQEPVEVSSDRFDVDTHAEIVTTDDPVVLSWNGQLVHAVGLIARLKEQRVTLKSDVHGRYVP